MIIFSACADDIKMLPDWTNNFQEPVLLRLEERWHLSQCISVINFVVGYNIKQGPCCEIVCQSYARVEVGEMHFSQQIKLQVKDLS